MPLGIPIQFTLYGDDDEVKAVYSRKRVPLTFVEQAIELAGTLEGDNLGQEQLNALYQIVVDFYGEKFSVEEVRKGADLGEMISVIEAITSRASELMPNKPNPIPPPD
jgi:hypothetical protein